MPQVKWWVANKREAARQGKQGRYIESDLESILMDWGIDATTAEKTDVKFIKVTYGKTNFIEFNLYSSENYTRQQHKMYQNIPIIFDRLQLVIANVNLKRKENKRWVPAATSIAMLDKVKYLGKRSPKPMNWVDLDKLNEIIMEIDEIMENTEEYEILDILSI